MINDPLQGVLAPVEDQVFTEGDLFRRKIRIWNQLGWIDDRHIQACKNRVIEHHAVQYLPGIG